MGKQGALDIRQRPAAFAPGAAVAHTSARVGHTKYTTTWVRAPHREVRPAPLHPSGPALETASSLGDMDAELEQLYLESLGHVASALSDRSRNGYDLEWRSFEAWCKARGLVAMPAEALTVRLYLTGRAKRPDGSPASVSLVVKAHAAIKWFHALNACPVNPADEPGVLQLVRAMRSTLAAPPRQAVPFTTDEVAALATRYATPQATDAQFTVAAGAVLSFHGIARPNDWDAVRRRHVDVAAERIRVTFCKRKNDQRGLGHEVYILPNETGRYNPHAILVELLRRVRAADDAAGRSGEDLPVLRDFDGHQFTRAGGNPPLTADALGYRRLLYFIRVLMARSLNLTQAEAAQYTAYSARRGGATLAADRGAAVEDLMKLGGWRSASSAQRYVDDTPHARLARAKFLQ